MAHIEHSLRREQVYHVHCYPYRAATDHFEMVFAHQSADISISHGDFEHKECATSPVCTFPSGKDTGSAEKERRREQERHIASVTMPSPDSHDMLFSRVSSPSASIPSPAMGLRDEEAKDGFLMRRSVVITVTRLERIKGSV
jgi:hypothetical protein